MGPSNQFQEALKQMVDRAQKEAHARRKQEMIGVMAALYDKAAAYTNLILAAGYAGFFAVWTTMNDSLSHVQSLVAALSVSFSLTIFVFWEVGVMIFSSKDLDAIQKALSAPAEKFESLLASAQESQAKRSVAIRRIWFPILIATVMPCLVGSGILMYAFVRQLLERV